MTPETIASAITAALSAGNQPAMSEEMKEAIADHYEGLHSLIRAKFSHHREAVEALDNLEDRPTSEGRRLVLAEELKAVDAASDPEVAVATRALLNLLNVLPASRPAPSHVNNAENAGARDPNLYPPPSRN